MIYIIQKKKLCETMCGAYYYRRHHCCCCIVSRHLKFLLSNLIPFIEKWTQNKIKHRKKRRNKSKTIPTVALLNMFVCKSLCALRSRSQRLRKKLAVSPLAITNLFPWARFSPSLYPPRLLVPQCDLLFVLSAHAMCRFSLPYLPNYWLL